MWGIIPAAGRGSRIQPLAFSKELLPVGSETTDGPGGIQERPRAVSEYLVERMILAGADKLCFVISPGKTDILEYFGARLDGASIAYVVQPEPGGLCDAVFRALPFIAPGEELLIGLPDTVWSPLDGFARLPAATLSFLLFPVEQPELFDAVVTDQNDMVLEIQVKQPNASSRWVWGGVRMTGYILAELHTLWCRPGRRDEYLGTLVNAWLREGGHALGIRAGERYVDVGTLHGYRQALHLLEQGLEISTQPPALASP